MLNLIFTANVPLHFRGTRSERLGRFWPGRIAFAGVAELADALG